jgi:cytosine/creatinine deaminase
MRPRSENKTFLGGEELLRSKGIEVVVLDSSECQQMMKRFIQEKPKDW